MNFLLRRLEEEDQEDFLSLYNRIENERDISLRKQYDSWSDWDQDFFEQSRFVLETEEKQMIGFGLLEIVEDVPAYKGVGRVNIGLIDDYRNKGIGKLLLRKLLLNSQEYGFWNVQAHLLESQKAAISVFQSQSFRKVGTFEKLVFIDQRWQDVYIYEKTITDFEDPNDGID